MSKNIFVFVVCGGKEHIETLHFSLRYLKYFSKNEIIIVTDSARNEIPVLHDNVIDVKTPENYSHHQASIYLKTGLHKFLPNGNNYCYLDTDVIALTSECDQIFNEFLFPIRFGPDHCKIRAFSPIAIDCGCPLIWNEERKKFKAALKKHDRNLNITDKATIKKREHLKLIFENINKSFIKKTWFFIRYYLTPGNFRLSEFTFNKKERIWFDKEGTKVLFEVDQDTIFKETGVKFIESKQIWQDKYGKEIWKSECNHLKEIIEKDFGIKVTEPLWQHWNGGVFLFNDLSHPFMESWHEKTLKIFNLPKWKIRDQGTLIATAWQFSLQNHPVLDKKWNFLADDNNPKLDFNPEGFFTENAWQTKHKVNFVHVYHRFGDKSWELWNFIESIKIDG